MLRHACSVVLIAALGAGCMVGEALDGDDADTDAEALAAPGVRVTKNVAYGAPGDAVRVLDIYRPLGTQPVARPVVVWIHGGGFAKNSRRDPHIVRLAQHSAQLGYVGVSIDYTLANPHLDPAHPYPYPWAAVTAARADAMQALRFLRAHAAEYGIDPQRIAVGGASAGAMTALEVAYGSTPADRDPGIRAVVDLWGAMEQQTLLQNGDAPLAIFHGTADHLWMPFAQAERLRDSARAHGVPVEFHALPGKNHGPWDDLDDYLAQITPFLRRYL